MMMVKQCRNTDISVLGEELLVEIFRRLGSVKSATLCKSVSKIWRSLVNNDSYWLHSWCQMNHNKESATLVCKLKEGVEITIDYCGKETPTVCINLDFLPCFNGKDQVHVLGSHKDLLLCCPSDSDHGCYYICNPFTKQYTALPPPPPFLARREPDEEELRRISMRTQAEYIVDERADKFTVVRIFPFLCKSGEKVQVSIFSSDVGWREMDDNGGWREMFEGRRSCRKIVSYRGRLVFLMKKAYAEEVTLYGLDLDSNYTRLPLIPPVYPTYTNPANRFTSMFTIGVSEGCLRMAQLLGDYKKLIVWQLDDTQRQEWDMLLELDFGRLRKDSRDWSRTMSLHEHEQGFIISAGDMTFHPHDGDILYMNVSVKSDDKEGSSNIFMCNLKKRRLELMRKTRLHEWCATLLPLAMQCWPTPVPRLQP